MNGDVNILNILYVMPNSEQFVHESVFLTTVLFGINICHSYCVVHSSWHLRFLN